MNLETIKLVISIFIYFTSNSICYGLQFMDMHKSDKTVTLHRIDLSDHTAIIDILEDVLSEKDTSNVKINDAQYYLIQLTPQGKGDIAYITEHTHNHLPNADNFIGYTFLGDHNDLIVIKGNEEHSIKFEKNNQTMTFNLERDLPIIYDPRTWKYYIYQNIYARYIWSIGWFWHIPREYEIKPANSDIITFPKRYKK